METMESKNKLREIRRERRLKQSTLARMLGIFQSEISEIETGVRKPSVYLALKIAKLLGKNIDEIFLI
jgi:putative transcriptional regulator